MIVLYGGPFSAGTEGDVRLKSNTEKLFRTLTGNHAPSSGRASLAVARVDLRLMMRITLRILDYGNNGILLLTGNEGFISSTLNRKPYRSLKGTPLLRVLRVMKDLYHQP